MRIGQVDLTKPEKPGNAAKIAGVKVRKYFNIFTFHATPPDSTEFDCEI